MISITLNSNGEHPIETIDILKFLSSHADAKESRIAGMRQVNFTMALFVFAGLAGFGISQPDLIMRICITVILSVFMLILNSYDHRLHMYLHGWRITNENYMFLISSVLNKPLSQIDVQTYYSDGQKKAVEENCYSLFDFLRFIESTQNTLCFIQSAKVKTCRALCSLFCFLGLPKSTVTKSPSRLRVLYYLLVRGAIGTLIPFMLIKTPI